MENIFENYSVYMCESYSKILQEVCMWNEYVYPLALQTLCSRGICIVEKHKMSLLIPDQGCPTSNPWTTCDSHSVSMQPADSCPGATTPFPSCSYCSSWEGIGVSKLCAWQKREPDYQHFQWIE